MTSTLGILPGYVGGVAGFRDEVREQPRRSIALSASALAGAVLGSILLLTTSSADFAKITPYLVLVACALFAAQPLVRGFVASHDSHAGPASRARLATAHVGTFVGSIYGGYFGAGLGVVLLALLGTVLPDELVKTNSLRAILSLVVNTAAALVFLAHGVLDWTAIALLAPTSLAGGYLGARVARRLPPVVFRIVVIALGLATAIKLFVG